MFSTEYKKSLTINTLNVGIQRLEFAIRGPLVLRAIEIEKELNRGVKKPFDKIIRCNVGDCHATGQQPITFLRQILSIIAYPKLMEYDFYPTDVKARAKSYLDILHGNSIGAYPDPPGIERVRQSLAEFITKRDGVSCDPKNVAITSGAGDAIRHILRLMICKVDGKKSGLMIPIPTFPLYSALAAGFGLETIGYYLEESENWSLNIKELERAIEEGRQRCYLRAIVVINPGNPTGQVLSRKNLEEVVMFAYKHSLLILADEVYQDNVYVEGCKFHSFRKVMTEMGYPYNQVEVASLMTVSKSYLGECGLRGGCVEVLNMCPEVQKNFIKSLSVMTCPNVVGQCALQILATPPQPGEPSYELFQKERTAVFKTLKQKAELFTKAFNEMEGFSCSVVQGALYVFPTIQLPPKALQAAKEANQPPDVFYAFELLENTGICIVPGTGFQQKPGTFHIRSTILPPVNIIKEMLNKMKIFHLQFMAKYK